MAPVLKPIRFAGIFLLVLAFVACKDDDPTPDPVKTEVELITQAWTVGKVVYNGQDIPADSFSMKFNENNTFQFNTPSIPGLPQQGDWQYLNPGKIIQLDNEINLLVVGQITAGSLDFDYTYK